MTEYTEEGQFGLEEVITHFTEQGLTTDRLLAPVNFEDFEAKFNAETPGILSAEYMLPVGEMIAGVVLLGATFEKVRGIPKNVAEGIEKFVQRHYINKLEEAAKAFKADIMAGKDDPDEAIKHYEEREADLQKKINGETDPKRKAELEAELKEVKTALNGEKNPKRKAELRAELKKLETALNGEKKPKEKAKLRAKLKKVETALYGEKNPAKRAELDAKLKEVETALYGEKDPKRKAKLEAELEEVKARKGLCERVKAGELDLGKPRTYKQICALADEAKFPDELRRTYGLHGDQLTPNSTQRWPLHATEAKALNKMHSSGKSGAALQSEFLESSAASKPARYVNSQASGAKGSFHGSGFSGTSVLGSTLKWGGRGLGLLSAVHGGWQIYEAHDRNSEDARRIADEADTFSQAQEAAAITEAEQQQLESNLELMFKHGITLTRTDLENFRDNLDGFSDFSVLENGSDPGDTKNGYAAVINEMLDEKNRSLYFDGDHLKKDAFKIYFMNQQGGKKEPPQSDAETKYNEILEMRGNSFELFMRNFVKKYSQEPSDEMILVRNGVNSTLRDASQSVVDEMSLPTPQNSRGMA